MTALDVEAEQRKLAHTLGVTADRLAFLGDVPAGDLRQLRAQIGEALFRADQHYFTRMAALTRSVPTAVTAKITELAMPPLLAARTSELLEPGKAADLVGRLSDKYLADVSAAMDPARCPQVVAAIAPERIATISRELARRHEWVVIGGFASVVSEPALRASVAVFDGEQLLRIGFVLDDPQRIDRIGEMLADDQIDAMLAAAVDVELWDELADQLEHLQGPRRERFAARFATAPASVRDGVHAAASAGRFPPEAMSRLESA